MNQTLPELLSRTLPIYGRKGAGRHPEHILLCNSSLSLTNNQFSKLSTHKVQQLD